MSIDFEARATRVASRCVLLGLAACRPSPPAAEPATEPAIVVEQTPTVEPATSDAAPSPACAAHRAALREEMCGDEDDCEAPEPACALDLDLDGDGQGDRVALGEDAGELVLLVAFATGASARLGAEPLALTSLEPGDEGRTLPPGLSWLVAWDAAPRDGDALVHGRMRFAAGPALGDGIWLSGTDAAAMLVWTDQGALVIELGY